MAGRQSSIDQGQGGWFQEPRRHSEAAKKGRRHGGHGYRAPEVKIPARNIARSQAMVDKNAPPLKPGEQYFLCYMGHFYTNRNTDPSTFDQVHRAIPYPSYQSAMLDMKEKMRFQPYPDHSTWEILPGKNEQEIRERIREERKDPAIYAEERRKFKEFQKERAFGSGSLDSFEEAEPEPEDEMEDRYDL